jgi:hypothetical protein
MRKRRNKSEKSALIFGGGRSRGFAVFAKVVIGSAPNWGLLSMVNHLARAEEMRDRAKQCQHTAGQTKSEKFADCYRLLSQNYNILATVEEEFFMREMERTRTASANRLDRAVDSISG